jgi:hypothetical protein
MSDAETDVRRFLDFILRCVNDALAQPGTLTSTDKKELEWARDRLPSAFLELSDLFEPLREAQPWRAFGLALAGTFIAGNMGSVSDSAKAFVKANGTKKGRSKNLAAHAERRSRQLAALIAEVKDQRVPLVNSRNHRRGIIEGIRGTPGLRGRLPKCDVPSDGALNTLIRNADAARIFDQIGLRKRKGSTVRVAPNTD